MSEYERWQARFSEPGYAFGKDPNYFFVRATPAAIRPGIGDCGWRGTQMEFGWPEQGLKVLSIDFSPLAQAKARALAAEKGSQSQF